MFPALSSSNPIFNQKMMIMAMLDRLRTVRELKSRLILLFNIFKKAKNQLIEDEQQRLLEAYYETLETTTEPIQTTDQSTIAITHNVESELITGNLVLLTYIKNNSRLETGETESPPFVQPVTKSALYQLTLSTGSILSQFVRF